MDVRGEPRRIRTAQRASPAFSIRADWAHLVQKLLHFCQENGRWDGLGPFLILKTIIAHSKGGVNAESVRGVSAAAGGLSSGKRQRGRRISVPRERCDKVWETHVGLGAGEEVSPLPDQIAEQMCGTGTHAETLSSVSECAPHDSSRHLLRPVVPSRFAFFRRGDDSLEAEPH